MNDYLTKPLNTEVLESKLKYWINYIFQNNNDGSPVIESKPHLPVSESNAIDAFSLNGNIDIWSPKTLLGRLKNNESRFKSLISKTKSILPDRVLELQSSIKTLNYADICAQAHGLKGMAASISAKDFLETCAYIEACGLAKDISNPEECVTLLQTKLDELYIELAKV